MTFREGDKVLVEATVAAVFDDDPHDPSVVVYFNGQTASTTIMNLRRVPPTPTVPLSELE